VWSLIVSFFGDAVEPRGGRVALAILQDLMGLMNIEPGAVRTALSRLVNDGVLEREREGRLSFFLLADEERPIFEEASKRIYAGGPAKWCGEWTMAVIAPSADAAVADELLARKFANTGGAAWMKPGHENDDAPEGVLLVKGAGSNPPPGLERFWLADGDLQRDYLEFVENWGLRAPPGKVSPEQAIVARMLIIHDWRRIVLRDPGLPFELLPADWPGEQARSTVRRIYDSLLPASESWLDAAGLPQADDKNSIRARFKALQNIAM
jgi:phenylacetic acid degradation operon negative regulatory protein